MAPGTNSEREHDQDRRDPAALRRGRAEATVEALLAELRETVTPAMLRAGLREALVDLAAAETPVTVQLGAAGDNPAATPLFTVLAKILRAAHDEATFSRRNGLSGERVDALHRKYQSR